MPEFRSVLFICTGNICRSPAAELLLRAGLGADAGIVVSSAGLAARAGEPVAPAMGRLLGASGVDARAFTARQLDPAHVRAADLVLTMTAEQRAAVVARAPLAVRRTFTLLEFAGLAAVAGAPVADGPADRLAALVRAVPRARAQRLPAPSTDDIEDPYGRSDDVFAGTFAAVDRAVRDLLTALGAPAAPGAMAGLAPSSEIGAREATRSSDRWSTRVDAAFRRHGGGSS